MNKEQELKEMLKLYSKQDLWNRIQEKQAMIYDLNAKLAESEKSKEYFADRVEKADREIKENYKNYNKLVEGYNKLKQQLAEKEKEIERVKQEQTNYYRFGENCKKVTIKTIDGKNFDIYNNDYQDKIDFAVERLEWLKEKINNAKIHKIDMINTHELYEILDNQINQLKELD